MERYAWKAIVLPGKLEEYIRRHEHLWPEMKAVLKEAGIRNYTIWNVGNECWNAYMKDVMQMDMDPVTGAQPLLRQVFLFE